MGWTVPEFAHVPLIHGPDGAKLSKRHGAQAVQDYRAMGYLPIALRNYLVRLGWSHGDDEIMSTEQLLAWFDIDDVGKSAARFDFKKLEDLNGHYIRQSDDAELARRAIDILHEVEGGPAIGAKLDDVMRAKFVRAIPSLKERAKTLRELIDGASYLFAERPLKPDDKALKLLDADARAMLAVLHARFAAEAEWSAAALEDSVRKFSEETGAKLGKIAQPLRAAVTGRAVSPPVFDVLEVLGRDEALARIADSAASSV
jgi:glutamyl-tRNA synthetase